MRGGTMDRRLFLKLTGFVAAASALEALPVSAAPMPEAAPSPRAVPTAALTAPSIMRLSVRAPGLYQVSGRVRMDAPLVEISGLSNSHTISWSGDVSSERRVTTFLSFEQIDRPDFA